MSNIPREPRKRSIIAQVFGDSLLRESLVDKDAGWIRIYGRVTTVLFLFGAMATLAIVLIWPHLSNGMEATVNSAFFGQWAHVKERDGLFLLVIFCLIVHAMSAESENRVTFEENKKLRRDFLAVAERVAVLERQAGIKDTSPVPPPIQPPPAPPRPKDPDGQEEITE
jgi:hypothetical protein